ncbi:Ribosomal protein [Parasponia andersonii]|uniref:Ribosomal protein n=1 Tax=Parasponia andersonii TaxID=3476 RepID=A0A2P5CCH4_PARAD|nr:Ribosomal protein [Parasponia andersonii]
MFTLLPWVWKPQSPKTTPYRVLCRMISSDSTTTFTIKTSIPFMVHKIDEPSCSVEITRKLLFTFFHDIMLRQDAIVTEMKTILSSVSMDIPDGVKIIVNAKIIEVEGPHGKLVAIQASKMLELALRVMVRLQEDECCHPTTVSHVKNLITSVTKGCRYKM